jgi:hypothetical protein
MADIDVSLVETITEITIEDTFPDSQIESDDDLQVVSFSEDSEIKVVTIGVPGTPGARGTDGKSAFELAVDYGFSGNQQAWLDSLIGEEGLSAYEVALSTGYNGTIEQWISSLQGEKGEKGDTGQTEVSFAPAEITYIVTDKTQSIYTLPNVPRSNTFKAFLNGLRERNLSFNGTNVDVSLLDLDVSDVLTFDYYFEV